MTAAAQAAALAYAKRGWAVFPCAPRDKVPITPHGQKDATTDASAIRGLFRGDCNVAIVADASGLAVIDVDPRNGGDATLASLAAELGALPRTLTADTGGGGTHYVFRAPVGCELRGKLGPGVDLKHRGYILAEPSVHPSGNLYRWHDRGIEPAELPPTWLARMRRPDPVPAAPRPRASTDDRGRIAKRASAYLAKMPPAISGQGGHDATFAAAVALVRGFDLDPGDAYDLLAAEFNPRCLPLWSERDLRHKIDGAARAAVPRGYLLSDTPPSNVVRLRESVPYIDAPHAAESEASIDAFAARDADSSGLEIIDAPTPAPPPIRYRAPELVACLAEVANLQWVPIRIGDGRDDEIASLPIGAVVPITAASGAGKTTLTLAALVIHARDLGPAILVSRELSHAEVAARIVGIRRGISWADAMRAGATADARDALSTLPRLVVLADDDATISKAEATVAALRADYPDQPVVVAFDYLQILDGDGTARDERAKIAAIAEAIRRFAKRVPALVLAVSQSSRAGANALRKGEVVGADTATTGAESSQIERGAYLTIAIGESVARDDGSTEVSLSIGKSRFGGGDRVIPCSFDGATGRWRVTGASVTAADHRAARSADKDERDVDTIAAAIRTKLADADTPMTRTALAETLGRRGEMVRRAVERLRADPATGVVECRGVAGHRGRGLPVWTRAKATAAGLEIVEGDAP